MINSPLPFIGEFLEFSIRTFSHVNDKNEAALKKELQRLKSGAVITSKGTRSLLNKHLGYLIEYPEFGLEVIDTIETLIEKYGKMVLQLNCHVLSDVVVRPILVRELVSDVCFAFPGKALMEIGVNPHNWLLGPEQVVSGIWDVYLRRRGISVPAFAKELAPRLAIISVAVAEKTVEDNLYRWKKTGKMNVRSILQLLKAGYEALAISLMYGNAFRKFYSKVPDDVRKSALGNWLGAYDHGSRICRFEPIIEELQKILVSRSIEKYPSLSGSDLEETVLLDRLENATNPYSIKVKGDAELAASILEEVERYYTSHEGVDGLQLYRARFHILNGESKKALLAFDKACTRQAYRNGPAILDALEPLLVTAVYIGDKRMLNKWTDWISGMGLKLDFERAVELFQQMYPSENFYREADKRQIELINEA